MRIIIRVPGFAAAPVPGAAGLLFLLAGLALAGPADLRAEAQGWSSTAQADQPVEVQNAHLATDNSADCGKCHSACEDGRTHAGLVATGKTTRPELPLDAEGRTSCLTCHVPRQEGHAGARSGLLRISNLQRGLCLACHQEDEEAAPAVEIVSPREGAVVREERLALIGRATRLRGPELTVRLNGSEFHLHVKDREFSTWLKLQDGVNHIEVAQERSVLWAGEVFRGEGSHGSYERTSSGHRTRSRAQCVECHLKIDELRSSVAGATMPVCYGCHTRIEGKRFVHGPLAVGDCLACHDPHGGFGDAHLRQEQAQLCSNCHAARGSLSMLACNPLGRPCVDCHDPHQSDARYLLKGPQYTMRVTPLELP